jgi:DNA-binding NtrC family response regulator
VNGHPKVLVVDDVEDWQLTIRGMLKKLGCEVILAGSSEQARKVLSETNINLAILDMRLDERDEANVEGLDLAEEIQAQWPEAKVIIATGYSTQEALQKAWEPTEGRQRLVADFIPKNEIESLLSIVKTALQLKG